MVGNPHSLLFHGSTMPRRSCAKNRTQLYTRKRGLGYSFQHLKKLSISGNWPKRLWSWWLSLFRYPLSLAQTQRKRRKWLQVGKNIVNIDSSYQMSFLHHSIKSSNSTIKAFGQTLIIGSASGSDASMLVKIRNFSPKTAVFWNGVTSWSIHLAHTSWLMM